MEKLVIVKSAFLAFTVHSFNTQYIIIYLHSTTSAKNVKSLSYVKFDINLTLTSAITPDA